MVQPKLISDVLRRRIPGTSDNQNSRGRQRSDSVSSSVARDSGSRSNSQKRKPENDTEQHCYNSYASIAAGYSKQEPVVGPAQVTAMEEIFKKVRESGALLNNTMANFDISPEFKELLKGLLDQITLLTLSQETLLAILKTKKVQSEELPSFEYALAAQKVQRIEQTAEDNNASNSWRPAAHQPIINPGPTCAGIDGGRSNQQAHQSNESERDIKLKKFRKAVEEAERSTLVLNLDLGRTRLINEETISTNVSKALIKMAAKVENRNSGVPSDDAIEAIDDVISVAKKMSFLGKSTKSVRNTKDMSLNGSYMTVPVKYEFQDRGTKFFADEVLRKTCNAQLSVPYPPILREGIKQIVETYKKEYPDYLIKVLVDTRKMLFKVSRRLTKTSEWIRFPATIPIPDACLEVGERDIPEGFKIPWPPDPDSNPRGEDMEESPHRKNPLESHDGPPQS